MVKCTRILQARENLMLSFSKLSSFIISCIFCQPTFPSRFLSPVPAWKWVSRHLHIWHRFHEFPHIQSMLCWAPIYDWPTSFHSARRCLKVPQRRDQGRDLTVFLQTVTSVYVTWILIEKGFSIQCCSNLTAHDKAFFTALIKWCQ